MTTRREFLRVAAMTSLCRAAIGRGLAPPGTAPITFENILPGSGIDFVLNNSASEHRYQAETMAGGVALFDYNNDGLLDIYFTNCAHLPDLDKSSPRFHNRLYRNNGNGTFTDVTESAGMRGNFYSMGVAAADYDNDGYPDLFVAGANGYQLFHNNGNGTFSDVTEKAGLRRSHPDLANVFSVAAGWFDYDNDGFLDLIVINYLKWSPEIDVTCISKGVKAYCSPDNYAGLPNLLFHNNGDGTFTDVSESSGIFRFVGKGMGVAFADYDGDGFTDIFIANDTYRNFLFHNNGNGTFTETGILSGVAYSESGKSVAGMGADFRDINNDGKPDIFMTDMFGEGFLYFRNLGNGIFEDETGPSGIRGLAMRLTGWGTGIFDFDNDSWKDIFTCNAAILDNSEYVDGIPYKMRNTIVRNLGNGKFEDVSGTAGKDFQHAAAHRGAAFGDLNNDGRIDIITNSLGAEPEIFINRTQNGHHWLLVELEGTRSNRDGLGAKIAIIAGGKSQYNHATTSVGYGSSSDRRVHFGLGTESRVETLEVVWPSGARQSFRDVEADQILKIKEPQAVSAKP
jgi:enediyne biosynthesis protein E4